MILAFTQKIKGKPTHFVAKILKSLFIGPWVNNKELTQSFEHLTIGEREMFSYIKPKLHTIRAGNRWKVGHKIHFTINNRTKQRRQFAPIMVVKSVQEISITWHTDSKFVKRYAIVKISNHLILYDGNISIFMTETPKREIDRLTSLAINDGFDSMDDFLDYFNEDFTGQIIHWTDKKY